MIAFSRMRLIRILSVFIWVLPSVSRAGRPRPMHDLHRQSLDIPSSRLSAVDRSPSLPASLLHLQSKLREFPILQIAQTIQPFNLVNSPRIQRRVVWVQLVDGVGFGGHESSGGSSSGSLAWARASRSAWR